MSVSPLRPNVRYYCSACEKHFHEHEVQTHEQCVKHVWCQGCGVSLREWELDDPCSICGAVRVK